MEIAKLLLDFIAGMAWPVATVWIVYLFRSEIRSISSLIGDSSKLSLKIAGQELTVEKELKEQIIRDIVAVEPANKEGKIERNRVIERLEVLIPFLATKIDTHHLILVKELSDAGGELPEQELFRRASLAGVRAGLGGKLTRLRSAGIIEEQNEAIILTKLGERVASLAPKFL